MCFAALMSVFNMGAFGGMGRYRSDAAARAAGENAVANVLGAAGGGSSEAKGAAAALVAGAIAAGQQAEAAQHAAQGTPPSGASAATADANAATDAAGAAASVIGSMIGGGKAKVEPVDFRVLRDLLPSSAGGLDRTNASGEKTAVGGISTSSAEGRYADGKGADLTIKISDMANASGVVALGRMALSVESENDAGFEKNVTLGGQKVHEKWSASGKSSELTSFVGDRFMVEVSGHGLDISAAEKAFTSIDARKLASSK